MPSPDDYLVCAGQRSGSTLLVESLAAPGVAGRPQEFFQYYPSSSLSPQPREWFAGVDDPSLLDLLDPIEPGTVDPLKTTARVLDALGQDPHLAPPPPLKPQSNDRSKEWAERYRADAAENGYPL